MESKLKEMSVPHVVLSPNRKSFDKTITTYAGLEGEEPNCENVTVNGVTISIPYNEDIAVPIEVAEWLKRTGRIKSYRMVKETI